MHLEEAVAYTLNTGGARPDCNPGTGGVTINQPVAGATLLVGWSKGSGPVARGVRPVPFPRFSQGNAPARSTLRTLPFPPRARPWSAARSPVGKLAASRSVTPESRGANRSLIASDGELHRDFRKAFNAMFMPGAIKRYEYSGRKLVVEILVEILARGECEFVNEVAAQLPMAIICDMMAIPRQDWRFMFDLVKEAMGPEDPEYHAKSTAVETRGIRRNCQP